MRQISIQRTITNVFAVIFLARTFPHLKHKDDETYVFTQFLFLNLIDENCDEGEGNAKSRKSFHPLPTAALPDDGYDFQSSCLVIIFTQPHHYHSALSTDDYDNFYCWLFSLSLVC